MNYRLWIVVITVSLSCAIPTSIAAPADTSNPGKVVSEATGGSLKSLKGKYFDKDCGESVDYEAEVVDLNGDGQPEVFTQRFGTCLGGMAGVNVNLYIKDKSGKWIPQFGFPGTYTVLSRKNKGYPDIEIGGPGNCFPIWRWNGTMYDIHKKCAR